MSLFKKMFGMNGMKWWIGTVEDRGTGQFCGEKDELKIGRVKVRIQGHHTEDKGKLPTSELPWAFVMQPTTSAAISGIGFSPTGIVETTKVVGFFMDDDGQQIPVVIGTLPHVQQKQCIGPNALGSGAGDGSGTQPGQGESATAKNSQNQALKEPGPGASIDDKLAYANARLAQSEINMRGPAKGSSEVLTLDGQQYKITY